MCQRKYISELNWPKGHHYMISTLYNDFSISRILPKPEFSSYSQCLIDSSHCDAKSTLFFHNGKCLLNICCSYSY